MNRLISADYRKRVKHNIFYVFFLFPLLGENIISTIAGDTISKIFSFLSCSIIIFFLIGRKIRLDKFGISLILLIVLHIAITFIFAPPNIVITVANSLITPYGLIGYFTLFMFVDSVGDNRDKLAEIYRCMALIMTICVFFNFFISGDLKLANNIEVFQEAISTGYTNSRKWLFGHRNAIFIHHLLWIIFSYLQYRLENRNYLKMFLFQIGFTMLVAIVSWNSTMLITTSLVFVLGIMRNNILSGISIAHYILIYVILEVGIVFVRIQSVFSFLIVNILHRNLSFTGRTALWDYYINQFIEENVFQKLIGNLGITDMHTNSHNMFLGLLAFTGIIGAFLFFFLLFLSAGKLMRKRKTDSARFISLIIFSFLINSLAMEFYLQPMLVFYIGYRIDRIE